MSYPPGPIIIKKLVNLITNKTPTLFVKFGDGEFNCMFYPNRGSNCDNDKFTLKLSNKLKESYKYIINNHNNYYIAKWNTKKVIDNCEALVNKEVNYAEYNTFILLGKNHKNGYLDIEKINIYKQIKLSPLKKVFICNKSLIKSKKLLNIDNLVFIPYNNWFDNQFGDILNKVSELIKNEEKFIIMTACGMSAKVLISELYKVYKNGIYLDIGNGLDYLCWKDTRGWSKLYNHGYLKKMFKDLIGNNDDF